MKTRRIFFLPLLIASLGGVMVLGLPRGPGGVQAEPGYQIPWRAFSSGGIEDTSAGRKTTNYRLSDAMGEQSALGASPMTSSGYRIYSGFREVDLDLIAPTSAVLVLPNYQTATSFDVSWTGADSSDPDGPGWGLWTYDVQYKAGIGGSWTDWLTGTTLTTSSFAGSEGQDYYFQARAIDLAANQEAYPGGNGDAGTTVDYHVPFSVVTAAGGTPMAPGNAVTLNYYSTDPGAQVTVGIYDGADATVWCIPGSNASLSNPSSGSTSDTRWYSNQSLSWTIDSNTGRGATYYNQLKPTVTLTGTDASNTAATEAHRQFGGDHLDTGLYGFWSDWSDKSFTLTFAETTSLGWVTTDPRSWAVTTPFSAEVEYVTGALHHFTVSTIPSPQTAGVPFSVTITGRTAANAVATGFSGTADLTDLTATVSPTVTGNFDHGIWTGNLTVTGATSADVITATKTGGTETGSSNQFEVLPGPLAVVSVSPDSAAKDVYQTQQFSAVGKDAYGNVISGLSFAWAVVNGGGTISGSGLFTCGSVPGNYHQTVEASSGGIEGLATMTVLQRPTAAGWNLVSEPFIPLAPGDPDQVFGDDFLFYWLYEYTTGGYAPVDTVRIAKGYWLGVVETNRWDVDGGTPVSQDSFVVDLPWAGWHLIGEPFNTKNVNWSACKVSTDGGTTWLPMSGYLLPFVYKYETGGYQAVTILSPWFGYWAGAMQANLKVKMYAYNDTQKASVPEKVSAGHWQLPLTATVVSEGMEIGDQVVPITVLKDSLAALGVERDASFGYDAAYDLPAPPVGPGDYVKVYFRRPTWNLVFGEEFCRDIRDPVVRGDKETWDFVVQTNLEGKDVRLTWPGIPVTVPAGVRCELIDLDGGGARVDMRAVREFAFRSGYATTPRHFQVTVSVQ
jgi:hypothetical protein